MTKDIVPGDIDPALHDEIVELLAEPLTPEEDARIARAMRSAPPKTFGKDAGKKPRQLRTAMVSVRLNDRLNQSARYWAEKNEMTVSDYVAEAIQEKIARANGDYDLPTLEIARQAQLIDEVKTLSITVSNLEKSLTSMIESIASMARNPSYMSESMRSVENG